MPLWRHCDAKSLWQPSHLRLQEGATLSETLLLSLALLPLTDDAVGEVVDAANAVADVADAAAAASVDSSRKIGGDPRVGDQDRSPVGVGSFPERRWIGWRRRIGQRYFFGRLARDGRVWGAGIVAGSSKKGSRPKFGRNRNFVRRRIVRRSSVDADLRPFDDVVVVVDKTDLLDDNLIRVSPGTGTGQDRSGGGTRVS